MPLLSHDGFVADEYVPLSDSDPIPSSGRITVGIVRFISTLEHFATFTGNLGLRLDTTTRVESLAPYLPKIALIVLPFPAFNDGRAYSIARQLRLDGYRGELRAAGNILPDQIQLMQQVGIDSFEVSDRFPLAAWQRGSRQMSLAYQRGLYRAVGEKEVWSERHQGFAAWEEQPHAG